MKKISLIIIALFIFASCSFAGEKFSVNHSPEVGGIFIETSIDDFNSLGYEYGDSLNFDFSNGKKLQDVPYYNGYYSKVGFPLLVSYPGAKNPKIAIGFGPDLWVILGIKEDDFVTVSLNEKGKYKDIQEARNLHYSHDRNAYSSDEEFANFRAVNIGKFKRNFVYRSASPYDNKYKRAACVDRLIKNAGIKSILNLADSNKRIQTFISESDFNSPYFLNLYENKCVIPCNLHMNFYSDEFRKKLISGFVSMTKHEGPYLIHCLEGKDRTGFAFILLSMLAGASYDEIENDYMQTYKNYYGLTRENDSKKYNVILDVLFIPMVKAIVQNENVDIKNENLAPYAEKFLLDYGMSAEKLNAFKACIIEWKEIWKWKQL